MRIVTITVAVDGDLKRSADFEFEDAAPTAVDRGRMVDLIASCLSSDILPPILGVEAPQFGYMKLSEDELRAIYSKPEGVRQ